MPKLRALLESPPEGGGTPEEDIRALRDYLARVTEELEYILTHLELDNTGASFSEDIDSQMPQPYTGTPAMDGVGYPGSSERWARGNHRHPTDTSRARASDLSAHVGNASNPHGVTKAQVGLSNVANERQYSADNPPPLPTPADIGAIPATDKGSAGGVAELDANGMVPSAQLPSYVDDVLEYADAASFPATGETGKIYVALDTNKTYRWGGSAYVEISESLALGETSSTAYRGDRGKTAYDHSQTTGNPHGATAADVGAQPEILVSGILMGDGLGGVSAAAAGTDYQTPLAAGTDYQTPLVAGTDYATPGMIPTVPDPSDASPQDLGTADAGLSDDYSRADHVHELPDAGDIPYDNSVSGLTATDVQNAIDEVAQGGGGGGPSPGANNPLMDGTAAPGTSLNYAREDHVHPSDTGKQDVITAGGILKGDGMGGVTAATAGTDYATPGMIPSVPSASTANPAMDGTAAPGSTGQWADGGHVHPTDTSRMPKNGLGKNLLHNWYFAGSPFPINQRGGAPYSGNAGYSIDRWYRRNTSNAGNPTLAIGADGIVLTTDGLAAEGLNQAVESKDLLAGKTVTLSALIESNTYAASCYLGLWEANSIGANTTTLSYAEISGQTGLLTVTGTLPGTFTGSLLICGIYCGTAAGSIKIKAVKLELGTEQTLAHQENGAWVLNEAPDYEPEYQKCSYYFQRIKYASGTGVASGFARMYRIGRWNVIVPLISPIRQTVPTVTITNVGVLMIDGDNTYSNYIFTTLPANIGLLGNALRFNITEGAAYTGGYRNAMEFLVFPDSTSRIDISCDL